MGRLVLILAVLLGCNYDIGAQFRAEDRSVSQLLEDGDDHCTAWHVKDQTFVEGRVGLWATAGHCAPDPLDFLIGEKHMYSIHGKPAVLLVSSVEHDIAVFTGPSGYPSLPLANARPAFGSRVHFIGYPWYGETHHVVMESTLGEQRPDGTFEFTAAVDGGASGSPVMNEDGEVLGILVSGYRGRPYTYYEPVGGLKVLLDAL